MATIESSNAHPRLKIVLVLIALSAYPALIHFSFAFDRPLLLAVIWLVGSAVGLGVATRHGRTSPAIFFGLLLLAGTALWWWGSIIELIYVPPVFINFSLMILFGRSLSPGATPLVARVASLWRGPLDPAVSLYTRRVTVAWTVFFALMAVESIALALFAPLYVWSLFTNFLNYILVLLFFVIEHQMRLRFPAADHEHLSFRGFLPFGG